MKSSQLPFLPGPRMRPAVSADAEKPSTSFVRSGSRKSTATAALGGLASLARQVDGGIACSPAETECTRLRRRAKNPTWDELLGWSALDGVSGLRSGCQLIVSLRPERVDIFGIPWALGVQKVQRGSPNAPSRYIEHVSQLNIVVLYKCPIQQSKSKMPAMGEGFRPGNSGAPDVVSHSI